MKKSTLILFLTLTCLKLCQAQANWANYSQTYPSGFEHDSTLVGIVANIEERNDEFWSVTNTDSIQKAILSDTSFKTALLNNFVSVATYSYTPAYFFVKNVNKNNAAEYEYRISEDKYNVLVPWSTITNFSTPGFGVGDGASGEMGYIGAYTAKPGHQIVVDVRMKSSDRLLSTAIVSWVSISPVLQTVFTSSELNEFLGYLNHSWKVKQLRQQQYEKGRPTEMLFKSTENSLIFYPNRSGNRP